MCRRSGLRWRGEQCRPAAVPPAARCGGSSRRCGAAHAADRGGRRWPCCHDASGVGRQAQGQQLQGVAEAQAACLLLSVKVFPLPTLPSPGHSTAGRMPVSSMASAAPCRAAHPSAPYRLAPAGARQRRPSGDLVASPALLPSGDLARAQRSANAYFAGNSQPGWVTSSFCPHVLAPWASACSNCCLWPSQPADQLWPRLRQRPPAPPALRSQRR